MAKPNSTVVVLVGAVTTSILEQLDQLPNVRAAAVDADAGVSDRELIARAHTAYVVHDRDPLGELGTAWVGFFDDTAPVGTLEVAMQAARRLLRRGDEMLPDYYIVLDPETLPATTKHWWFGALASAAPSRVVPSAASASAVAHELGRLPPGRWWPEPADEWLQSLDRFVPDAPSRQLSTREQQSASHPDGGRDGNR